MVERVAQEFTFWAIYQFIHSLFLSWVVMTQPNHWCMPWKVFANLLDKCCLRLFEFSSVSGGKVHSEREPIILLCLSVLPDTINIVFCPMCCLLLLLFKI